MEPPLLRFLPLMFRPTEHEVGLALLDIDAAKAARSTPRIEGLITGPYCAYARTLPATYPIRSGQVSIVDPCYWTPELPFLYQIEATAPTAGGTATT
jgi:hypothetical protein